MSAIAIHICLQLLLAIGIFVGGMTVGSEWRQGRDAVAQQKIEHTAALEKLKDEHTLDMVGMQNANDLAALNKQLGDARAQLGTLTTGRSCLNAPAVRVLNAVGPAPSPQPAASQPASPPGAFATDRDVGDFIAICRGQYAAVSSQLNAILDIEDARFGPIAGPGPLSGEQKPQAAGVARRGGLFDLPIQPAAAPRTPSLRLSGAPISGDAP